MRITAQEKLATRERIIEAALELFRTQGFETTTTRDIARSAGIAAGTLFNYFTTKEAIVASIADEAQARTAASFDSAERRASLEESLFALVAAELRQLKPLRKFIRPVLETVLTPLAAAGDEAAQSLRLRHLEAVSGMVRSHGLPEMPATAVHLYWTLYTGVLAFWAKDPSPRQEDTLAMLDDSMSMFVGWLQKPSAGDNSER